MRPVLLCLGSLILVSCAAPQSPWRTAARLVLDKVQMDEAAKRYPAEFSDAHRLLAEGDQLLDAGMGDESEARYRGACSIASLIESKLERDHATRQEALQETMESAHLQISHSRALLEQGRGESPPPLPPTNPPSPTRPVTPVTPPATPAKPLVSTHTVRRGETLPQIAARPEVYGDSRLWPLIYRSNRDQISDPRRLWPGQVLRIPRSYTPEEMAEARRFAAKKPLF
ncbi:MAG: DUF4398 domain-containing protein [Desulfuromonadia bacterium]